MPRLPNGWPATGAKKYTGNRKNTWMRAEGPNPWLVVSFLVSAGLMVCILLIPALQSAFRLMYLTGTQWLILYITIIMKCRTLKKMEVNEVRWKLKLPGK